MENELLLENRYAGIRLDQFNSLFLVQVFHQSHASERKQNKNAERKQKRINGNHNIRKKYMQGSDQSVHKWNTKTDMLLLSLFCHINNPDTSMHMYINFNTLLKAGSLMISFVLMDPPDLLPSVNLKPWEKENMKPVAQLNDFT